MVSLSIFFQVLIVVCAVAAVFTHDLLAAVAISERSAFSQPSISPSWALDVAFTEAAVGAVITTVFSSRPFSARRGGPSGESCYVGGLRVGRRGAVFTPPAICRASAISSRRRRCTCRRDISPRATTKPVRRTSSPACWRTTGATTRWGKRRSFSRPAWRAC